MTIALRLIAGAIMLAAFAFTAHAQDGDAKKGAKVFKKCKICHEVGPDAKHKTGPMLNNIIGAKAGAQEGFVYSKPMAEAGANGLEWTEENLSEFLKKPKKFMPGTKMVFIGVRKDKQRQNLIAYLKTFTDSQ